MIDYKFDTSNKYVEELFSHLDEHDQLYIGETEKESYFFYAIENESLVGAVNVYYNWNWVIVLNLFYDNAVVLHDLIYEVSQRYKKKANGIHFRTYDKERLQHFISIGFTHSATIESMTVHNDLCFLDFMNLDFKHTQTYEVTSQSEKNAVYNKILEEKANYKSRDIRIPKLLEETKIVALNEGVFIGGLLAEIYENSFHIDAIVVVPNYRGRYIGRKLMELAEEKAIKRGVPTMDLSTGEYAAKPFYEKIGYQVVYTRENYPNGFQNYKLIKQL